MPLHPAPYGVIQRRRREEQHHRPPGAAAVDGEADAGVVGEGGVDKHKVEVLVVSGALRRPHAGRSDNGGVGAFRKEGAQGVLKFFRGRHNQHTVDPLL